MSSSESKIITLSQSTKNPRKLQEIRRAQSDFSETRSTQIACVLNVLAEAIERVKISLILPKMLEDINLLRNTLINTQYAPVLRLVNAYIRRRIIFIKQKRIPLTDHGIIKLIDYFQENRDIYKLFPQFSLTMTREEQKLLKTFEMLYDVAYKHLHSTSKSELIKERMLCQMYYENEGIQEEIRTLKDEMYKKRIELRWKKAAKAVFLRKFEDDLARKKWQNNVCIQEEIDKCRRAIRNNNKESLEKQAELTEELEKVRAEYFKKNKDRLIQEKNTRAEKNKLLIQLQGLIKKYDHSIGEKMRENLQLQDEYKKAKTQLDKFLVTYREVEFEYREIVVAREEEERRKQQRRIVIFMMNRAARKIQKYWRKWRKEQRKKNKRLKKGKK